MIAFVDKTPVRSALAALVTCCAAALCAAPTASAFELALHVEQTLPAQAADRIAAGGTDMVRTSFYRSDVQKIEDAPFDWTISDAYVASAAAAGLEVLPVLLDRSPAGFDEPQHPPLKPVERVRFRAFAEAAVERYGPGGSFWAAHPELVATPISIWQAWNEPNLGSHWDGLPKPKEYVKLLKQTRSTILQADPTAQIMLAGMPQHHHVATESAAHYLARLYEVRGFSRLYDIAAVHSYTRRAKGTIASLKKFRRIMDAQGDDQKPVWITEFGWSTAGPKSHPTVTTEQGQADRVAEVFDLLKKNARRYRLGGAVWFGAQDPTPPPGVFDRAWFHSGLFDADGSPKPAWQAYTDFAGGVAGTGPLYQ